MKIYNPRSIELIERVLGCGIHCSCLVIIFADENFRDSVYLAAVKILVCEMSRRDDKASSCNHDIDLVIGGITFMLIDPCWFDE